MGLPTTFRRRHPDRRECRAARSGSDRCRSCAVCGTPWRPTAAGQLAEVAWHEGPHRPDLNHFLVSLFAYAEVECCLPERSCSSCEGLEDRTLDGERRECVRRRPLQPPAEALRPPGRDPV